MKIGIIGPPQSGKTTAFKILLEKDAPGHIGIFKAMDHRVDKISEAFASKKTTYPEFSFVDIGPVSSIEKKDFCKLQDIDLFICVVGAFFSEDPKKDFEGTLTDVIISDLDVIQNMVDRLNKEGKKQDREQELKVLEKCQMHLSENRLLSQLELERHETNLISGLVLVGLKPLLIAINTSDQDTGDLKDKVKILQEHCRSKGLGWVSFFGKTESELLELGKEERKKFLKEMGTGYDFREDASRSIREELDLITFFTNGAKERRGG